MGNIPGIASVEDTIYNLRQFIERFGSLPENALFSLEQIRNSITQIASTISDIQRDIIERIDSVLEDIDIPISQVTDILSRISLWIDNVKKRVKRTIIAYVLSLLLFIGICIFLYKFIMEGTMRLGIDRLLVLAALIVISSVMILLLYLYTRISVTDI